MAPSEIFSYIPVPEHPSRLRQMLPIDAQEGLALLAYYRNTFVNACTRKDQNTADCVLDIIIHLRYRLIKLGEFLEDPASHLFAVYYEQSLPCMIYGTPLKIDFSPSCDLMSLVAETDIDEGIEIADNVVDITFGDFDCPTVPSAISVETKKGKTKKGKKTKKAPMIVEPTDKPTSASQFKRGENLKPKEKKDLVSKERVNFFPKFDSPLEHLPNLHLEKARNKHLAVASKRYLDVVKDSEPEDLGTIECDIWDCLDDLVVCTRGKEAIKLLEVLHPVEIVKDGTACVKRPRTRIGYEAVDHLFHGCPSTQEWLLTRQL